MLVVSGSVILIAFVCSSSGLSHRGSPYDHMDYCVLYNVWLQMTKQKPLLDIGKRKTCDDVSLLYSLRTRIGRGKVR